MVIPIGSQVLTLQETKELEKRRLRLFSHKVALQTLRSLYILFYSLLKHKKPHKDVL